MEQTVIVNGEKSAAGRVTSGASFHFADDTKLFRAITSKEDALHLQSDVDAPERWLEK